jgi:hypothetical protein
VRVGARLDPMGYIVRVKQVMNVWPCELTCIYDGFHGALPSKQSHSVSRVSASGHATAGNVPEGLSLDVHSCLHCSYFHVFCLLEVKFCLQNVLSWKHAVTGRS